MRLLTRSDFDGLACGSILKGLGIIDHWKFVHPKDIQDGLIEVTKDDVLANIPYAPGCGLWFDHHASESERLGTDIAFKGKSHLAPSAARIVYEYYGGEESLPMYEEMVTGVDRVDSGNLKAEDILHPTGWVLLGFVMDPRTGLGRFRNFSISNYQLMEKLMDCCRSMNINELLELPDVKERLGVYFEQDRLFKDMMAKYTTIHGNVILTDLRNVTTIYAGNRFLIYSLYPDQNISIWAVDGRAKLNCAIAVGHSILNRTSQTDVGSLMLKYGGGGHKQVGTCQVSYGEADRILSELVKQMREDG